MKKIYACTLLLLPLFGMSQQGVQFTQYMYNRMFYNPGVAGSGGAICASIFHRTQWQGFDGAPTTQNIGLNAPVKLLRGGIGLNITNDQIGFFQDIQVGLAYGYQLQLSNGTLGIGAGLNIRNMSVNSAQWSPSDGNLGDPDLVAENDNSGLNFDNFSFGVYYESENIWAGISTAELSEANLTLDSRNNLETVDYTFSRHYYLMGGYNWEIPSTNWTLMPSTLIKSDFNSSPALDVNITGMYNNKVWGGVTYRLQDAVAVNLGYLVLPSLKVGYSYDVGTSAVSSQGNGSHEIMARYCFKIEIPPPVRGIYRNPRFL